MSDTAPYLQRNPGPDPVDVPAIPATVQPGEAVAWYIPIAGFEPVLDDPAPAPDPKPSKKAASAAPSGEETTP